MASKRIIYARGFPYGAPLVMIRGGATCDPEIRAYLRDECKLTWDGTRYAWTSYLDRLDLGPILKTLRDRFGCDVMPKGGMDSNFILDLDNPNFSRPGEKTCIECGAPAVSDGLGDLCANCIHPILSRP